MFEVKELVMRDGREVMRTTSIVMTQKEWAGTHQDFKSAPGEPKRMLHAQGECVAVVIENSKTSGMAAPLNVNGTTPA